MLVVKISEKDFHLHLQFLEMIDEFRETTYLVNLSVEKVTFLNLLER